MKRPLHDLSVLFDDDGKAYVVWGYRSIHIAQLTGDFTDIVPGTERELIPQSAGMGEGLHFYKIRGKYDPDERVVSRRDADARGARRSPRGAVGGQPEREPRRRLRPRRRIPRGDARSTVSNQSAGRLPAWPVRHPSRRSRRHPRGRVVGFLDDGRERHRSTHGALANHVDGRLAVLRPARKPRAHTPDVDQTEHRISGACVMRRINGATTSPPIAFSPSGNGITCRSTTSGRCANGPGSFGFTRWLPLTSGTRETRSRSVRLGRARA